MQARGITEKAYVERCTAGGTLPTSTAAEPRTRPVATPSKLLRQCRPRNRVPHRRGLLQTTTTPSPFWRSTSASTPQSLEFLVSGSRRTPRRPALSGNASPPARRRKSRTGPAQPIVVENLVERNHTGTQSHRSRRGRGYQRRRNGLRPSRQQLLEGGLLFVNAAKNAVAHHEETYDSEDVDEEYPDD
jgi:hypothetical protein